jgi:TolB-like protein
VTSGDVTVTGHTVRVDEPTPDQIKGQLERMLASPVFATATRLRAFLRYVVERTLAGDAASLKEYAIGVDVFERDETYDPRIDSIVRVEAGRLRAKLEEYYGREGAVDPIIINVARGSYVPVFTRRAEPGSIAPMETVAPEASAGPASKSRGRFWIIAAAVVIAAGVVAVIAIRGPRTSVAPRPSTDFHVAVLPFTHYASGGADQALAARITDIITTELARLNVVAVVSRTTVRQVEEVRRPLPEMLASITATTAIEGSVFSEGDRIRVRTRIVDGKADRKGDIRDFEGRRDSVDDLARRIAEELSATFQARALR